MKKLSLISIVLCGTLIFGGIGSTAFGETEQDPGLQTDLTTYPIEKEIEFNPGLTGNLKAKSAIDCANGLKEYYAKKAAEEEAARLAAEAAEVAKRQASKSVRSIGGQSYSSGGAGVLTKSGGVNYFNGRRETWYSQRVLPGGGLKIPGRHVDSQNGTVKDGDGYVCVAASDLPKGTVVETSLGTGKVYDTGCAAGTTDVYVDW